MIVTMTTTMAKPSLGKQELEMEGRPFAIHLKYEDDTAVEWPCIIFANLPTLVNFLQGRELLSGELDKALGGSIVQALEHGVEALYSQKVAYLIGTGYPGDVCVFVVEHTAKLEPITNSLLCDMLKYKHLPGYLNACNLLFKSFVNREGADDKPDSQLKPPGAENSEQTGNPTCTDLKTQDITKTTKSVLEHTLRETQQKPPGKAKNGSSYPDSQIYIDVTAHKDDDDMIVSKVPLPSFKNRDNSSDSTKVSVESSKVETKNEKPKSPPSPKRNASVSFEDIQALVLDSGDINFNNNDMTIDDCDVFKNTLDNKESTFFLTQPEEDIEFVESVGNNNSQNTEHDDTILMCDRSQSDSNDDNSAFSPPLKTLYTQPNDLDCSVVTSPESHMEMIEDHGKMFSIFKSSKNRNPMTKLNETKFSGTDYIRVSEEAQSPSRPDRARDSLNEKSNQSNKSLPTTFEHFDLNEETPISSRTRQKNVDIASSQLSPAASSITSSKHCSKRKPNGNNQIKASKKLKISASVNTSNSDSDTDFTDIEGRSIFENPIVLMNTDDIVLPIRVTKTRKLSEHDNLQDAFDASLEALKSQYNAGDLMFHDDSPFGKNMLSVYKFICASIFSKGRHGVNPDNPAALYVCGPPGIGKTSGVLWCCEKGVDEHKGDNSGSPVLCFVKATLLTTTNQLYTEIGKALNKNLSVRTIRKQIKRGKREKDSAILLVVDEFDKLISNGKSNQKDNDDKLPASLLDTIMTLANDPDSRLVLVGISNSSGEEKFQRMQSKGKFQEKVVFNPYNADELQLIIQSRIAGNIMAPSTCTYISKKISQFSGDLRKALEITAQTISECGKTLATDELRKPANECIHVVKVKHAMSALKTLPTNFSTIIDGLPAIYKAVLCVMMVLPKVDVRVTTANLLRRGISQCLMNCHRGDDLVLQDDFMLMMDTLQDFGLIEISKDNDNGRSTEMSFATTDFQHMPIMLSESLDEVEDCIKQLVDSKDYFQTLQTFAVKNKDQFKIINDK